ncbi:MAG TPA: hypothetical protein VFF73_30775, partial [Planctomycetota bacterium]|nr:hypothetical protein [Planctomycetota bacterium]
MARGNALLSAMIAAKARFKLDEALAKLDAIKALAADLKKTKRPDHERAADALLLRGTELAREAATLRELRDAGIIVRATLEDGRPGEKNRAVIAAKDVTERVYEPLDDMKDVGIRGRNVTIVAIRFGAVTFRYKDMTFNRALGEE